RPAERGHRLLPAVPRRQTRSTRSHSVARSATKGAAFGTETALKGRGMKTRILGIALIGLAACVAPSAAAKLQAAKAAAPAAGVEARLPGYMNNFLPYDPASKVTVEKSADRLPGFQGYKIKRTGKYAKLNMDVAVYVSDDGKWFFD